MTETLLNNRYQITDSLGKGGFGETFLAIDTHMPSARKCALKKLKPAIKTPQIPQWLQERFQREAAILEKLGEDCTQIPKLYAYFCEAGNFYLVQEWIEGVTLRQKHQQQGNFSASQVRDILIKLLPILDYIHQRRIIHRDIKPDNIIWRTTDSQPVLIDFGVVKEAVATAIQMEGNTAYSIVLGTPGYMASEQAAGRPAYSSDLFSLGLTAVFLLTGKTPQYLSTDSNTGELIWREDLPDLDRKLAIVIDRAIRFHPRDRFATAREMLAALGEDASDRSLNETTPVIRSATSVKTYPQKQSTAKQSLSEVDPVSSQPEIRWLQWGLGLLLLAGIMAAAFAIGFYAFTLRQTSEPTEVQPEIPDLQNFPSLPSQGSPTTPEATSTPEPEATINPSPEVTTSPSPEATTSPSPEANPTPEPEATISPSPEATASPSPEATTSPSPEATASPSPEATSTPEPEATTSPSPEATSTPEPEATTSPSLEVETDFPKNSAAPSEEPKTQTDENTASPMPTPNLEN
jgi:serine/threonine-protein kinase